MVFDRGSTKRYPSQALTITRTVKLPDWLKIARYQKVPDLGPRILFFSGGTALKSVSQELIHYTHNSIHLITPFDSGGSSAKLRSAFNMLSVGDMRNRLMALADQSVKGNPDIYDLFAHRLPRGNRQGELLGILKEFIRGEGPLMEPIPNPMKSIICNHIQHFLDHMPGDFNLSGASIGNLILAGGYLNNQQNIDNVLYLFSRLVEVRGMVKPVVSESLHLVTELEDGTRLLGQHLISAKEAPAITSPVKRIFLSESLESPSPSGVAIAGDVAKLIRKAELIVYPMGSFYSSVLSNLLPAGVGAAVASNHCPKVYIPNTVPDPEQLGMNLVDSLERLLGALNTAGTDSYPDRRFVDFVLLDTRNARYPFALELDRVEAMGVCVIDTPLVTERSFPYIDTEKVVSAVLSLT